MKGLPLSRRALLCSVAAGAGRLLWCGVARARDLRSTHAASSSRQSTVGLIPRHVLFGGADRSVVRLSPDGRRIAFLAPIAGVLNLWVADVRQPTKARSLTRVSDRDLGSWVVWLPNNRHVVFFRDRGGDENWQAHRVDLDTGEILALSPGPGVKAYVQQTSHHFPDELLIAHNQRDPRYSDIFRVNVATGETTLLETNDRFVAMFTDPQFRVRYGVRQSDDGATEYLQRGVGGEWEVFARIDMADAMSTRAIEFSDDGTELYWVDSRGRDTAATVAEDLGTGARRVLAHDEQADMADVLLAPRTYRPLAAASVFTRRRWRAIDPACAPDFAYLARLLPGEERSPLTRVDRIVRPLLIAQGANDVRVKPSESEQIVAAMQARRIPVTYISYSDEGHGFGRKSNRNSFTAVVEAFLAAHLGGRFEPVGDDFGGSTIEFRAGRELIPGLT